LYQSRRRACYAYQLRKLKRCSYFAFAKCVGIINIIIVTRMVPKRTWVLFIALKCKQSIKGYIFLVRGPLAFIDFAHRDLRSSGDIVTPVHFLEAAFLILDTL